MTDFLSSSAATRTGDNPDCMPLLLGSRASDASRLCCALDLFEKKHSGVVAQPGNDALTFSSCPKLLRATPQQKVTSLGELAYGVPTGILSRKFVETIQIDQLTKDLWGEPLPVATAVDQK